MSKPGRGKPALDINRKSAKFAVINATVAPE
jgi:hypothetical protein